ncbi:hypothetical protein QJT78_52155, partial [Bradyrhizobium sp. Mp27]|nr:hypothetical protein [Bradyrhizobium sp. Mp27]
SRSWRIALLERFWQARHPPRYAAFLTPSSPRFRHSSFREEFDRHIGHVNSENAALPWDRLGHWAQDDEDWAEAERCFRKAYDLAGGEYGYCLAIALKALERFDESVPLLLELWRNLGDDGVRKAAYRGG